MDGLIILAILTGGLIGYVAGTWRQEARQPRQRPPPALTRIHAIPGDSAHIHGFLRPHDPFGVPLNPFAAPTEPEPGCDLHADAEPVSDHCGQIE